MDFIDDPPEISEQERFQRHNRFLRSLKSDTLLIIDNFNVTATQDSFLSVVLKYRCQILFTTRSNLNEYCTFQLKEIKDIGVLLYVPLCVGFGKFAFTNTGNSAKKNMTVFLKHGI